MMRLFWLTILTLGIATSLPAQFQVKKGGLFGLKKDQEQISSGLFPSDTESAPPSNSASSENENIFRSGTPQKVEDVSYVIKDGEKVDRKGGFFSRNKKHNEQPVIDPVPAAPVSSTPAPQAAPVASEAEIANFSEEKKKGGLFSFGPFGKKSEDSAPQPVMSTPVVATAEPTPVPATAPQASPAPKPEPTTKPSADPVPTFVSTEPERKKDNGGGLMAPIKNLNPIKKDLIPIPHKEVDMTGAETIIQNGEIVDGDSEEFVMETESANTGSHEPPKIVNGVKTYSSWDDVDARSLSPADKILNQIR